jgi:hypothetical protein
VPQPVVSQSVVSQPVSHHQPGTTKPDGGVSA